MKLLVIVALVVVAVQAEGLQAPARDPPLKKMMQVGTPINITVPSGTIRDFGVSTGKACENEGEIRGFGTCPPRPGNPIELLSNSRAKQRAESNKKADVRPQQVLRICTCTEDLVWRCEAAACLLD